MADSVQRTLSRADPILGKAMRLLGPCTLKRGRGSPYEALLSAIVHQQIHGNAAAAIELLTDRLQQFATNADFLAEIGKQA